jgi:chromosome segregation ATPase
MKHIKTFKHIKDIPSRASDRAEVVRLGKLVDERDQELKKVKTQLTNEERRKHEVDKLWRDAEHDKDRLVQELATLKSKYDEMEDEFYQLSELVYD